MSDVDQFQVGGDKRFLPGATTEKMEGAWTISEEVRAVAQMFDDEDFAARRDDPAQFSKKPLALGVEANFMSGEHDHGQVRALDGERNRRRRNDYGRIIRDGQFSRPGQ